MVSTDTGARPVALLKLKREAGKDFTESTGKMEK